MPTIDDPWSNFKFDVTDADDIEVVLPLETDESLRSRLLYVGIDTQATYERIARAAGKQLDLIAADFGLRRRKGGK